VRPAPTLSLSPLTTRRLPKPGRPFWIGLGITGGFIAATAAVGIAAQLSSNQLQNTVYVYQPMPPADLLSLRDRVSGLVLSTDVLLAASAVALGVTVFLPLIKPRAEPPRRTVASAR
jgi:hypothetical protein